MVDVQKIDAFFNGQTSIKQTKRQVESKHLRALRFAKLVMPSVAALLIGLILVFPNFKKNNMITQSDVTMPKKGEFEKLHAEDASFSMTDSNGKISSFTAETMDETQSKSKVIKIIKPKGKIPLKESDKFVDIQSDVGYFNQKKNVILLQQNVKAVYDKSTHLETNEAEYDFNKAYGKGQKALYAYGDWGKLWADSFAYDKNEEILYLNGNSKLVRDDHTMYAHKQARYYKDLQKIEAEGNVILNQETERLYADKVIVWFEDENNLKLKKVEGFGNVKVELEEATAYGDYGLYIPQDNDVFLEGNVSIHKDGNVIYGDKVTTNVETKISKMISTNKEKRVSGVIRGSSIRRKKNEKK